MHGGSLVSDRAEAARRILVIEKSPGIASKIGRASEISNSTVVERVAECIARNSLRSYRVLF